MRGMRVLLVHLLNVLACGLALAAGIADASDEANLGEVSAKLSNPVSDLWAINMQLGINFSDGDLNRGAAQVGGFFQMQPALPIPLYKDGERTWRMILRPTIPVRIGAPVPKGFDDFDHETGLSDMLLPFLFAPSLDHWILGAGPGLLLPTSMEDAFGRRQWGAGPAVVVGYKTKKFTAIVFPNYIWGFADRGDQDDTPDASCCSTRSTGTCRTPGRSASTTPRATTTRPARATNGTSRSDPSSRRRCASAA